MNTRELFSEEQWDYLIEMMNIGAGNAATALSHLLQCPVNLKVPDVDVLPAAQVHALVADPARPVVCLRMRMVGDLAGYLFFIVPEDQKTKLSELAERALLGPKMENPDPDRVLAALAEIGNILAGVYLTAIHDFCQLSVCHSVPVTAVDLLPSLLDESLARRSGEGLAVCLLIKNEFDIGRGQFRTYFLILPSAESVTALVASIKEAGEMYGNE